MSEHLKKTEIDAPLTLPIGKVNIPAVREGLAMVMDGLRVMAIAGVTVTRPLPLQDGRLLLPAIALHDHDLGVVMDEKGSITFTVDGKSVMEAVMDGKNESEEA